MDAKTLEALKGSIAHWERLRASGGLCGPFHCRLCHLFYFGGNDCDGCPVAAKTGKRRCAGTPYSEYVANPCPRTAQAELDFLKSLLPEDATPHPRND